jgi:ABC-type nitrate/sulfonate/bicarbonate transport system substrate-binding protein
MVNVFIRDRITRRRALRIVGGSAIGAAATIAPWARVCAQAPKPEVPRVVLGQAKAAGQSAQFPLAIANKFFSKQGLDVSMQYFNSGAEMNEALASGSLHVVATGDVPGIGLMAHRGPAKCIAPLSDFSYDQGLVVRREIKSPRQLEGTKLGLTKGTTATMLIELYAQEQKLDIKKIGLVHMSAPEQIPAMVSGDLDGLISWEPWLWTATQKVPGAYVLRRATNLFKTHNLLLVSDQYATRYPETIHAVLRALLRANEQLQSPEGRRQAAKLVHDNEVPGVPEDELLQMIQKRTFTMAIDPPLIGALQNMTDFLHSVGKINRKPDVKEWFVTKFLRSIRSDLVTVNF